MKNKILIILLLFVVCFVVTGCSLGGDKTVDNIEEFTYKIPSGLRKVLSESNGSVVLHDRNNRCYITIDVCKWCTKPISIKTIVDDEIGGNIGSDKAVYFYNKTTTTLVDGHEWAYNVDAANDSKKIYVYATIGKSYDNPDGYYDGYNRVNYYTLSASDYNPERGICKGYVDSIIGSIKYKTN